MDGPSSRSSLFSSGTVIAAIISGVTALVTALLPWLLGSNEKTVSSPVAAGGLHAPVTPGAPGFIASRESVPASPKPNFAVGTWTIVSSVDEAGSDFTGSTLKFISQHESPGGLEATGFFEWRGNGELLGREHVTALYDQSSRQLFIEGKYVESPADLLAIGSFSARLSADGRQLLDGTWGNTPGNRVGVLGTWEARR